MDCEWSRKHLKLMSDGFVHQILSTWGLHFSEPSLSGTLFPSTTSSQIFIFFSFFLKKQESWLLQIIKTVIVPIHWYRSSLWSIVSWRSNIIIGCYYKMFVLPVCQLTLQDLTLSILLDLRTLHESRTRLKAECHPKGEALFICRLYPILLLSIPRLSDRKRLKIPPARTQSAKFTQQRLTNLVLCFKLFKSKEYLIGQLK